MPTRSTPSSTGTVTPTPPSTTSVRRPHSVRPVCRSSSSTASTASRALSRPRSSDRCWTGPGTSRTRGWSTSVGPSPPTPAVRTAARSEAHAARATPPSDPLGDRVDLVGDETVGLAVDRVGRLRVRGVDQAEDLALVLVDPVAEVLHVVRALRLRVGGVGSRHVVGGDVASLDVVDIHEQRHDRLSFSF